MFKVSYFLERKGETFRYCGHHILELYKMVTSYKAFLRNDYIFGLSLKKIRRDGWMVSPGWVDTTISSITAASDLIPGLWQAVPAGKSRMLPCSASSGWLCSQPEIRKLWSEKAASLMFIFSSHLTKKTLKALFSRVPKSSSRWSLATFPVCLHLFL